MSMPGRQFALEMCRHSSDLPCSQSPCQKTKIREAGRCCRSKFPVLFQLDPAPSFGALEGHMFEEVCSTVVFLCNHIQSSSTCCTEFSLQQIKTSSGFCKEISLQLSVLCFEAASSIYPNANSHCFLPYHFLLKWHGPLATSWAPKHAGSTSGVYCEATRIPLGSLVTWIFSHNLSLSPESKWGVNYIHVNLQGMPWSEVVDKLQVHLARKTSTFGHETLVHCSLDVPKGPHFRDRLSNWTASKFLQ